MVGFAKAVGATRGTTGEAAGNATELEAAVEAMISSTLLSFQGEWDKQR